MSGRLVIGNRVIMYKDHGKKMRSWRHVHRKYDTIRIDSVEY